MVVMTESWNEQRLDDLNGRVDRGFAELRAELVQLRTDVREGVVELRAEMKGGDAELRAEIGGLQRTLLQVGGGLIGTVIASTTAIIIAVV